ncbi:alpha/beta hydrolase [Stappia sp.]|jgi:esterase/lipase superfamily enzyme|uniref:alpha/beta hydrolase n=1 Tax=Stappia sp. TaxID=1870903 RepID=UPI003A99140C
MGAAPVGEFRETARIGCRRLGRATALVATLLLLAACAVRPGVGMLKVSDKPLDGATDHTVLVATTRERAETPYTIYNGQRADVLDHAMATVSVPPTHKPGEIEWASIPPGDPRTDFTLRSSRFLSDAAFLAEVNRQVMQLPKGKREVFVFVHGFNTTYPEALYRIVQLRHDSGLPQVPVLFTWASAGRVSDYLYDTNSATIARDALEKTLRTLTASKAEKVNVLAHSMGNWVLTETMRQIRISGRPLPAAKMGLIAMAAPDVDVEVFKAQMKRVGKPDKPFVILVSKDDRALRASNYLAGGKGRLGAYEDEEELARLGAVIVDLTQVKAGDSANHGKYTQLAQAAPELQQALRSLRIESNSQGSRTGVDTFNNTIGDTAKAAVTFPLKILTAPLTALSR